VPIRVTCPFCGRVGRGPERAVGRTVRCPGCSQQYKLTADLVQPGDQDEPALTPTPTPVPRPRQEPTPSSVSKANVSLGEDIYALDETAVEPPKRPSRPMPPIPAPDEAEDDDRPAGLHLSMPMLVSGALGVALVSMLAAWGAVRLLRAPVAPGNETVAAASEPSQKAAATQSAPASAPSDKPVPATVGDAEPGMISVAVAMQTTGEPAPLLASMPEPDPSPTPTPTTTPEPEPAGESDVASQARAAAGAVVTRDDGAGKVLSTADIVAESEPSVALIKGNGSSGTGFLVGPGLVATNSHVIDDELIPELEVRFVSADAKHNSPLKAELLYEDPERDLAFLAVKSDLKPLRVAKVYAFRKGEDITVIGNPGLGDGQVLENAISRGVMSTKTQIEGRNFYQLGIAINPGNSGGPVFDSSGRVIGVATLKASKQEATGFSIPIEDLQEALAKLSKQSTADADKYRSRHRILATVKALGGGGALMCLLIDLRRADALGNNAAVKELLGKLEPVTAELEKEMFPALTAQAGRIKNDPLIAAQVKSMVSEMNENFGRIRGAYSSRKNIDDNQLRPWKQAHKRLLTDLSASLKLEVPAGLMVAFDDHVPSQPTTITMGPQSLGSLNSRLRQRSTSIAPRSPGGITRPPSLRDRMGRRSGGR
jgi:S1-C subfamily serine protease